MSIIKVRSLNLSGKSEKVSKEFYSIFNRPAEFYVRVPGRVNLIGEHIDYCGYGVCPMALEQEIFLAVALSTSDNNHQLILHNTDKKYEHFQCTITDFTIEIPKNSSPKWYQYFLCGIKGILETLDQNIQKAAKIPGLCILVDGNIPPNAGLSSSSALVSAAALAVTFALKLAFSKEELATICAKCERYIGTQGGGMDQAIAFLAEEGNAKLIQFDPLRSTDIKLPQGAIFVIAHSLSNLNKAATVDYNCRVVECRIAAQILAKKNHLNWMEIRKLGDVQKALQLNLENMISLAKTNLKKEVFSKVEILEELSTTPELLNEHSLTENTRNLEHFKLLQRALHVFQEAKRVEEFHETCMNSADEASLIILGKLMSESHKSLQYLYECSHPQLDKIVDLAKDFTLGCRLTGAGWGGCTVSLVTKDNLEKFRKHLIENFYKPLGVEDVESVLFSTAPKSGACIYLADK